MIAERGDSMRMVRKRQLTFVGHVIGNDRPEGLAMMGELMEQDASRIDVYGGFGIGNWLYCGECCTWG